MPETDPADSHVTVVGIGASAGGLAALRTLFSEVPADNGLAWVVVVHLSPERESHLPELLQKHCSMPVEQVTETVALEADRVYVIPPNANLEAIDTHLRLSELEEKRRERAPIDHFFRTLSKAHDGHAVGVVLSGSGGDGAIGLREIKDKGGLALVQDPSEAEYDGMPRSAMATGAVDRVLPLADIPRVILGFVRTRPRVEMPEEGEEPAADEGALLQKVFAQIRARTQRDFTRYKRSTIMRRIARRMQLIQVEELEDYLERLRSDAEEVRALADDFLITVTSFFRDEEVFERLEKEHLPALFEGKGADDQVRVWSVGCATGEEAYSLAMLLLEEAGRHEAPPRVQVFASDLHERSLDHAREGYYPGEIEQNVSEARLKRFFRKHDGGYQIRKEVRDRVVFSPHNLLGDPPFSRLDLVACRNVLIYLQRDVQPEVLALFHYALRDEGVLLLGPSESVEQSSLFRPVHKGAGIYRRRNVPGPEPRLPVFPLAHRPPAHHAVPSRGREREEPFGTLHQRMVERYAPPSVLVDADDRVVHLSERAGRYLVHPGGDPTDLIHDLVRPELRIELRSALHDARRRSKPQRTDPVLVGFDGEEGDVRLEVIPGRADGDGLALVVFVEAERREGRGVEPGVPEGEDGRVAELEAELVRRGRRLRGMIEEYEAAQEELRASNEELQSSNEELRSTLEELETSKEELQSMNEELQTVNQENRHKVEELDQLTSDLQHLLAATDIATLFLDRELRILRYTPQVARLFNVRPSDRGRPLADLTHRLGQDGIVELAAQVLETLVPVEREVRDESGRWYLNRVLPYRSPDDRIEGVVITFVDITARKESEDRERAHARLEEILNVPGIGILTFDREGTLVDANDAFIEMTGYPRKEVEAGRLHWRDLTPPEDLEKSERQMEKLQETGRIGPYEKAYFRKDGSRAWMLFAGARLDDGSVIEYCVDMTREKRAEAALREYQTRFRALAGAVPQGFADVEILMEAGRPSDFRFVEVNAALADETGLEELEGRRAGDASPGLRDAWLPVLAEAAERQPPAPVTREVEAGGRRMELRVVPLGLPGSPRAGVLVRGVESGG